jgi:hypothetical protein
VPVRRLLLAGLVVVGLASPAWATTAASCENKAGQTDVQDAITATSSGGTVTVPAGSCTWTTQLSVSGKALTIQGAGIGSTNITLGTGATIPIDITTTTVNKVRITGFTFIKGTLTATVWIEVDASTSSDWFALDAIRIDHNRFFDNGTLSQRILNISQVFGLIDHNTFDIDADCTNCQWINHNGTKDSDDGGYTAWAQSGMDPGTQYALFIEDNVFDRQFSGTESLVEGYGGSRTVFRFNTVTNGHTGQHGLDSGDRRGGYFQEEYGNTFAQNDESTDAGTARGGVSIYFGNTHTGSPGYTGMTLFYPRPISSYTNDPAMQNWKTCDGTQYDVASATLSDIGSRRSTTYGTVARFSNANPDALPLLTGAATGDAIRPLDGPGTDGYPCRDQLGVKHNQLFSSMYAWNNGTGIAFVENQFDCITGGSNSTALCQAGFRMNHWIASDRDYYQGASGIQTNATTPFNGTTGVGWGTLANRPTTCTTGANAGQGVGYWATDQGSWNTSSTNPEGVQQSGADGVLYQCTATNTWTAYYTPYTYPHPLQGASAPVLRRFRFLRRGRDIGFAPFLWLKPAFVGLH